MIHQMRFKPGDRVMLKRERINGRVRRLLKSEPGYMVELEHPGMEGVRIGCADEDLEPIVTSKPEKDWADIWDKSSK